MANQDAAASGTPALQWKWVLIGVVVGALVIGIIVGVTASAFRNVFIPALIACVGFVVTGIIVGYYSPGVTVKEAAIGGMVLSILLLLFMLMYFGQRLEILQILTTVLFGYLMALVGGWVGENLQQNRAAELRGMHWKWVGIGIVVSIVLNSIGVFGLAPLFKYNLTAIFVSFLVTFVIAGYAVGYFSAGVTIKEAAIAGLLTVVIDLLLIDLGLGISVPVASLLFGMTAGFLLSMLGAWLGEQMQASAQLKKGE